MEEHCLIRSTLAECRLNRTHAFKWILTATGSHDRKRETLGEKKRYSKQIAKKKQVGKKHNTIMATTERVRFEVIICGCKNVDNEKLFASRESFPLCYALKSFGYGVVVLLRKKKKKEEAPKYWYANFEWYLIFVFQNRRQMLSVSNGKHTANQFLVRLFRFLLFFSAFCHCFELCVSCVASEIINNDLESWLILCCMKCLWLQNGNSKYKTVHVVAWIEMNLKRVSQDPGEEKLSKCFRSKHNVKV